MTTEQIAFQVSYASVESADSSDPTGTAVRLLREQRVLAAVREFDGMEITALIPVTDSGAIVALDEAGLLRFDLTAAELERAFSDAGLTLHLASAVDALGQVDAELDEQFGDAFEMLDAPDAADDDDETDEELEDFDESDELDTVRVAEFSHRGPWAARLTAQIVGGAVDYLEADTWSLYRYRTDQAHAAVSNGKADLPILEVNLPTHGEAWVEVTAPSGRTGYFWVNGERLTMPVLDLSSIAVPESAELYRRMLIEADGVRDELMQLGMGAAIDIEQAVHACTPEALGGIEGTLARVREFIAAFGVPTTLIEAGLDDQASGRRFSARGWARTIGDWLMGGLTETAALTRRDRPMVRFEHFLRKRPLVGMSLSTAELAFGVGLSRGRSRIGRGIGILMVLDASADLAIWAVRMLRRR